MIQTPTGTSWDKSDKRSLLVSGAIIAREYLALYPRRIAFAIVLMLLSGLLEGVGILTLLPALDILLGQTGSENQITEAYRAAFALVGLPMTLITVVSVMVLLVAAKSLLLFAANIYVAYLTTGLDKAFRLKMIRGLMRVRWQFFTSEPIGRLANSILNEAHQTANTANALMMIASYTIQAVVYLSTALLVSWQLTLTGIAAGIVIMFVLRVFIEVTRKLGVRITSLNRSYSSLIIDWLHEVKPLKAMGLEERVLPFLERETHALMVTDRKLKLASQAMINLQEPITTLFIAVGVVVSVQYLDVTTAALLVMVALFARSVGRISGIQQSLKKLARLEAPYFAFTSKVAAIEKESEIRAAAELARDSLPVSFTSRIEFDHVTFRYGDKEVLRDFCATIEVGKITTVVGPSGIGKSTMIDLLTAILEPQSGRILVDGVDLRRFQKREWRSLLGYVPQEITLMHATIGQNLTLGDDTIGDDAVEQALRSADAWDFVNALPEGIDTIVGERGLKFSGGQRQRLSIARALVHRPRLLLLDEATSALDRDTERSLSTMLSRLVPKVTIVAISHRSAIEAVADVTYRLEEGRAIRSVGGVTAIEDTVQATHGS